MTLNTAQLIPFSGLHPVNGGEDLRTGVVVVTQRLRVDGEVIEFIFFRWCQLPCIFTMQKCLYVLSAYFDIFSV